jgi:outer membrane receptor for ferric coprogen and ferric-rhodotorulic acid
VNNIWNRLATLGLITTARRDTEQVSANAYNYDNASQGWEGEVIANVTPNWRLMANLATNKTSWTNVGTAMRDYIESHRSEWVASRDATVLDQLLQTDNFVGPRFALVEGTLLQISPKWSGNLRTNYGFREGFLKGVSAGAGARWRNGMLLGYTSTDPATRQPIRSGSTTLVDANVGYRSRVKLFNRNIGWSLQLNANNLLNNERIIPQTAAPDGSILNYRFQTPREWFVTSTFTF